MVLTRAGEQAILHQHLLDFAHIDLERTNYITSTAQSTFVYKPRKFMMAEEILKDVIVKNIISASKFTGKFEQDVKLWIRDISASFDMAKFYPSQALQVVPGFLCDNALGWYLNNRADLHSWDIFLQRLRATYSSPAAKQIASQKLRTRKQGWNESVTAYYTDIIRLCKTVDDKMTNASKLDHLQ
ncbi:unnamed protein product [Didymodactylos carnosus]|uniref:Retrotransposon gag domain-containing protein n=1 Tax=Didymodactylos carnosus TaxID=1234261 RepID=A0A815P7X8_9BILA|nr:unnamed protein product [Didymodactylos carnosus]CAF4320155.1 unnamed protein product [Didymodactylos carnosus]